MTQPGQPYEQYEVPPAGQEYTGHHSPQPPYSAQPYNQPYSAPPQPFYEPGYPQPQPPVPPRHNSGLIALIASLGVLAVVAVAIVVVTVVRRSDDQPSAGPTTTTSGAATTAPAPVGPVTRAWSATGNRRRTAPRST